jgi:F420-non-reducing hydrogenase iron-sulfur subunit
MHLGKKLLEYAGLNPERLRLEWVSASQGIRFAEVVTDFTAKLREFGPLGSGEGLDPETLKLKLEAITKLLPYVKLVERERLRVRFPSKAEYETFFASDELKAIFNDLIADKLAVSQIMLLLKRRSLSTGEIAKGLGMSASEVSRHLKSSARQRLIRFDESEKRYALA